MGMIINFNSIFLSKISKKNL